MEINKILTADILDIIFDGRNKDMALTICVRPITNVCACAHAGDGWISCCCLLVGYLISNYQGQGKKVGQWCRMFSWKTSKKKKRTNRLRRLHRRKEPPKVEMAKFTPPKIVKDEEVKAEEKPPEVEKLEDTKIGDVNQEGIKDDNITAPPADNKGVVEAPKDNTDYDKTFTKVEIESEYPGGMAAWQRYLQKNLQYPEEAQNNEIQGQVVVKFIVDKEGKVSEVEAISGPNELREEAVRVIRKSGNWTPAIQNGRKVKSYKSQPIKFRLESQ